MTDPTYLDLLAEDGRPLRHKYLQQPDAPEGLVVLLPGDNYGVEGPLLYYTGQELWELGWDTLAITYGYQSAGLPFNPLMIADVLGETLRAIKRALAERGYTRLVLVGKSLGAALAALLCQQLYSPAWTVVVYLTPPIGPIFNPVFLEAPQQPASPLEPLTAFTIAAPWHSSRRRGHST